MGQVSPMDRLDPTQKVLEFDPSINLMGRVRARVQVPMDKNIMIIGPNETRILL